MQNYKEIALTDVARDAVMQLQENIKTIASSYAGTAFPTENLIDGMLCFRTDERKYYTYNAETETWEYGLAKALKYKGQAESYSDLPTEGNEVGDMWNIQKADKTAGIKAGDNVAWSGTEWDNMGGKIDLSDYALVTDQLKDVTSATSSGATITLIQRDGTKLPFTIDNVANATKAAQDGNGNNIASTYATKTSVASVAKYSSASTGSGVNPVYLSSGTVTASTSSVGASNKPIYMSSGALTASSSTIGGTAQPLYMSSGTLTALSATVGSSTKPVYLSSGTITASNSTVGASNKPIYLKDGEFTVCGDISGGGSAYTPNWIKTKASETSEAVYTAVSESDATSGTIPSYSGDLYGIHYEDTTSFSKYLNYNDYLQFVYLPNVTNWTGRFLQCNNLKEVHMPAVTSIGSDAFSGCSSLTTVDMPAVTSIGSQAFYRCSSLTTVDMPAVTSIENNAFSGCSALTTVDMPAVTSIGSDAFSGCSALKEINFPLVTEISDSSIFSECYNVEKVTLGITDMSNVSFNGNTKLKEVHMPAVTSIGSQAFYRCSSLTTVDMPAVTSIGSDAFYGCSSLTTVDMPAVTRVGDMAFQNCTKLTSITLSACTEMSGSMIFEQCENLKEIHFSATNKSKIMQSSGYSNKWGATNATIVWDGDSSGGGSSTPMTNWYSKGSSSDSSSSDEKSDTSSTATETLEYVSKEAYQVKNVDYNTFSESSGYTTDKVKEIHFEDCQSVGQMGDGAAWPYPTKLVSVSLPMCRWIDSYAFKGASSLVRVSLPNARIIDQSAFYECATLGRETVTTETGMTETYTWPLYLPMVKEIQMQAFYNCTELNDVYLPSCTYVASDAFSGCGKCYLHFAAANQATIESLDGYSNGFGIGSSSNIYFDA